MKELGSFGAVGFVRRDPLVSHFGRTIRVILAIARFGKVGFVRRWRLASFGAASSSLVTHATFRTTQSLDRSARIGGIPADVGSSGAGI
jgi:hypothetical protein